MSENTQNRNWWLAFVALVIAAGIVHLVVRGGYVQSSKETAPRSDTAKIGDVVEGVHVETGLIYAEGFDAVRGNCLPCHSAKLITQNRATREGWAEMIDWMQAKQGLWDLGKAEPVILDYLAEYYAPKAVGRRPNLNVEQIEWYVLDLEE